MVTARSGILPATDSRHVIPLIVSADKVKSFTVYFCRIFHSVVWNFFREQLISVTTAGMYIRWELYRYSQWYASSTIQPTNPLQFFTLLIDQQWQLYLFWQYFCSWHCWQLSVVSSILAFNSFLKHLYPTVSFISFVATGIMRAMKLVVSVSQF